MALPETNRNPKTIKDLNNIVEQQALLIRKLELDYAHAMERITALESAVNSFRFGNERFI